MSERPTRILAKYNGHCYSCGQAISIGDPIIWVRGKGVWCPLCYDPAKYGEPEQPMEKTVDRPHPYFGPQRKRLSRTWP